MVVVPRLHEMKYLETRQSAKIIELTKHWKTDSVLRLWSRGTTALYKCIVIFIIIIIIHFPVYYEQINVIRSKLIWTSWRPRLKIWAYGLKFLGVFTPKRPLLKTLPTRGNPFWSYDYEHHLPYGTSVNCIGERAPAWHASTQFTYPGRLN